MKYFAYGSNMSLPRLRARVSSAERIGVYSLAQHTLRFHKASENDGSGKCDAFLTGNPEDAVIGSVFEISAREKHVLDKIEGLGLGYQDKVVLVSDGHGNSVEAVTYYAIITDPLLRPYSWYLNHVVFGAQEAGISDAYLAMIKATKSIDDPNRERDRQERAIYRK